MGPDDEICYCFHVTKRKITQFLRVRRPKRASQLSQCGGAGTGCGWCRTWLERYFREMDVDTVLEQDETQPADYAQLREKYIRAGKGVPAAGATPLPDKSLVDESNDSGSEPASRSEL